MPAMKKTIHHEIPFHESTKTKLFIYEKYIQAWLQVFLNARHTSGKQLRFYDFFSGPGLDLVGNHGSPLILMEELLKNKAAINSNGNTLRIYFNDNDKSKVKALKRLCDEREYPWLPDFRCLDFVDAFEEEIDQIGKGPSLVFMDQFGVKHVTETVFRRLTQCRQTDILFFIASDYKRRFGDLISPELGIPESKIDSTPRHEIHRLIASRYRRWAPEGYHVGHFSIKKDSNIYGLIFGSGHWRGMEKFVSIVWGLDSECGDANFPIEAERNQSEMDFGSPNPVFKKKKLELFKETLEADILAGEFKNDGEVFLHCITNGISPARGAGELYKEMKESNHMSWTRGNGPRYSSTSLIEPRRLPITNGT